MSGKVNPRDPVAFRESATRNNLEARGSSAKQNAQDLDLLAIRANDAAD